MVFHTERRRDIPRRLVIAFIAAAAGLFALPAQTDGENSPIGVEISPEKIIVDQRFDLTIFADFPSYGNVAIKEPRLPEGITLAGGPYKSAQTVRVGDLSNPRYIKKTLVFYKFKVSKPGIYTIGSFTLNDGTTTLSTDPVMFPVLSYDERNFKYPVFARWEGIPDKIYVGETVPFVLMMENMEELSFPDSVKMDPPSGGMFERVNSVGEISTAHIGDDEVYIAPIDSWLYTPTTEGRIKIPGATVKFGDIERSTEQETLQVLPIPAEIEASGAIGSFEVSVETDNLPPGRSGNSMVRIRVEGEGNLAYLRMPQPVFSGFEVIEKEEVNSFVPSAGGYRGYREDLYRISAGQEEVLTVTFPLWKWLDRDGETVKKADLPDLHYRNEFMGGDKSEASRRTRFKLLSENTVMSQRPSVYDKRIYYLLLLPGLAAILTALVRKRYEAGFAAFFLILIFFSSSSSLAVIPGGEELARGASLQDSGEHGAALDIYDSLYDQMKENPAYLYNRSLILYDMGRKGEAVFSIRKALTIKPGSRLYSGALGMMEEDFGLDHQLRATTGLSPDLFYLFFILLFNGGAMIIALNVRKRKMELSILVIMIFFLSALSLGIVHYTDYVAKTDTAVVSTGGGNLKKVPGELGGEWMTLQEGTSLRILSRSGNSLLIRTGYGLEGWLPEKQLLFLHGEG